MSQKHVIVLIVIIATIGLGLAGWENVKNMANAKPTPTPSQSPEDVIFGSQTKTQTGNPDSQTQQSVQPTKSPKQYRQFPGELSTAELSNKKAVITTDKGKIEFEIYPEASKAASNFVFLTRDGFYDGLTFHRVEPGFVIQGGDPAGNGTGGPGYEFADEPVTKSYDKGIVAMANAGPNTNGSQFFIMLDDNPSLPPKYTIFGKVTSGQDIVDKIKVGNIMKKVTIENTTKSQP